MERTCQSPEILYPLSTLSATLPSRGKRGSIGSMRPIKNIAASLGMGSVCWHDRASARVLGACSCGSVTGAECGCWLWRPREMACKLLLFTRQVPECVEIILRDSDLTRNPTDEHNQKGCARPRAWADGLPSSFLN